KITAQLLKCRTGEFDLESILFLTLRGLGTSDLGCIGDCLNIERLDISDNNITNLTPLSSLKLLIVLNASCNRITNLDALSSCENLQSLNVAGNLLSSFDSLRGLTPLKKLENIRLKNCIGNFTNPVCISSAYRSTMLDMFPNIKVLDGERVSGRGSDLFKLCKDIDNSLKGLYNNGPLREIPSAKPWVEKGYWDLKPNQNIIIEEAYKQFNDILQECKELRGRANDALAQAEKSLSVENVKAKFIF
uniref:Leucine rich repeat containing 61 n=1 Tax=Latimeria chalumnae TaxID=7897 RepID=H3A5T9_LATCH